MPLVLDVGTGRRPCHFLTGRRPSRRRPRAAARRPLGFRQRHRASASGLLTGAGLPLLFVAYVQRDGPGTTCYRAANSVGCNQHLNPVPWLIIGAVLVLTGLLTQTLQGPKHRQSAHRLGT